MAPSATLAYDSSYRDRFAYMPETRHVRKQKVLVRGLTIALPVLALLLIACSGSGKSNNDSPAALGNGDKPTAVVMQAASGSLGPALSGVIGQATDEPVPAASFQPGNAFTGELDGHEIHVYAGALKIPAGNGLPARQTAALYVFEYESTTSTTNLHEYSDPRASTGVFTITGVSGASLQLKRADGSTLTFDLSRDAFGS